MKIIVDNSGEYKDVMGDYYNLSKYDDSSTESVLFQGYNNARNKERKNKFLSYKKRVYLNLESPISFLTTKTTIEEQSYFTHVYTLCPYTVEWLKEKIDINFISIPFPISLDTFNQFNANEKKYDVIYMGTLMNNFHYAIINCIKKYNHVFTSLFNYPLPYTPTHVNVDSITKWNLLSKSKISVCLNQAPFGLDKISNVKSYPNWQQHKAFSHIEYGIVPQIKSRVTEAMALKTLNLVKRDQWNVIEYWFKPDVHFIYWDNFYDLKEKINHIKENFDQYQEIINNAYNEVKKYDIDYLYLNVINK